MQIEVAGPGRFAVDVVGVSRRQEVLEAAAAHGSATTATLVPVDDNPHDDQAVEVRLDAALCGYLSRADARRFRTSLAAAGAGDAQVRCQARIVGGFARDDGERAHYGLKLDLPPLAAS